MKRHYAMVVLACSICAFPKSRDIPHAVLQSGGIPASLSDAKAPPRTLGGFKKEFLNQDIILNDVPFQQAYCLQWTTAQQKRDGGYEASGATMNHLPFKYKGQTARVVDIQFMASALRRGNAEGTNAFGETISEDQVQDPRLEVAVQFPDGTLALVRGFPLTLVPDLMELAGKRQAIKDRMDAQLPTIIGQKLYAIGYSKLYQPTATLEELSSPREILARLSPTEMPRLEPLTITKAKYLPDVNAVLLKLSFPNGAEAIAYTPSRYFEATDPRADFLATISGTLLTSIPKDLVPREIEAIKAIQVFRGMRKAALMYALGFPEKENDWGSGGTQLIYFNGKLVVYVDNTEKVQDWQNFN